MEKILLRLKKIIPRKVFLFFRPPYHFILSFAAAVFYGFPSRRLKVIGITGTKGKTSVIEILHEIFAESGLKTASASSLRFRILNKEILNYRKMTMPGRFFVQKFLHEARCAGCEYAILEITSEGVKQFRHRFLSFAVALMTNVAPEHLEAHGGFENYLRAKLDLFYRLSPQNLAIINADDPYADRFSAATAAHKMFYGKNGIFLNNSRRWEIKNLQIKNAGIEFEAGGEYFASRLDGEFNFYNILAAISVAFSCHLSADKIKTAIWKVSQIPGRMEFLQKEPFGVVADYAHTPDSLRKVYAFLRRANENLKTRAAKMICVLGAAGGGRDKWKRPELGAIAAEFCDQIILTDEDPYDENPAEILDQISAGFSQIQNSKFKIQNSRKILDRREAIREALKSARAGDLVVVTGKGAEPWIMGPNNTKIPWDDRKVVKEELKSNQDRALTPTPRSEHKG